jgi:hypothetical protein
MMQAQISAPSVRRAAQAIPPGMHNPDALAPPPAVG